MGSLSSQHPDIFEIYARYCDIVSENNDACAKESLIMLSNMLESRGKTRDTICNDLFKLMSSLDLSVDSHQFSCFYDFVFYICRENGQKNITVKRAISAWRLVLTGRFRLLNQWCDFVEKNQRHNISVDTWQQLLAFSRCVNEDLEGYDPKGAWPVLIDDFVEHMYRISQSRNCSTRDVCCSCANMDTQPSISNTFKGLKLLPGSKRRFHSDIGDCSNQVQTSTDISTSSSYLLKSKRPRVSNKNRYWEGGDMVTNLVDDSSDRSDATKHSSVGSLNGSPCAVEDCLSKGFEGHLSIGCCFQFDQKSRVSYT